ncbi:MAG: RecX family transcriptional regulator [Gemmatimonadota bacterium]|nr:MAG: RecX family transcriptional regulator [Gemmatimonadota bacterium]
MGRGGVITKIEVQKRSPDRRSIFIDNAFAFGLAEEIVVKNKLRVGLDLTDDHIERLLLNEEEKKAREYVFNLLSYRDRSCREVRDRLQDKGYDADIIDRVVQALKRSHLLDDERFALEWGRNRLMKNPMGARLLSQELWKKGIPQGIIDRAIEHLYDEMDEVRLATSAIENRRARYKELESHKAYKRLSDFLARRGFSWDVVREVLQEFEHEN